MHNMVGPSRACRTPFPWFLTRPPSQRCSLRTCGTTRARSRNQGSDVYISHITERRTPPTPRHEHMGTIGDTCVCSFFDRHFITRGALNTTPPTAVRLKIGYRTKLQNYKIITQPGAYQTPQQINRPQSKQKGPSIIFPTSIGKDRPTTGFSQEVSRRNTSYCAAPRILVYTCCLNAPFFVGVVVPDYTRAFLSPRREAEYSIPVPTPLEYGNRFPCPLLTCFRPGLLLHS